MCGDIFQYVCIHVERKHTESIVYEKIVLIQKLTSWHVCGLQNPMRNVDTESHPISRREPPAVIMFNPQSYVPSSLANSSSINRHD